MLDSCISVIVFQTHEEMFKYLSEIFKKNNADIYLQILYSFSTASKILKLNMECKKMDSD